MAEAQNPEEGQKPQKPAAQQAQQRKPEPSDDQPQFQGFEAEIIEINQVVKTGIYGEIYQVACRILSGKDTGRIIRRNMLGPAKVGDIIRLPDTSREAKEIKVK
ncbi:MAG: hypothetical protein KGH98_00140 [Candidatus Micrarchaeota archaeon]|nr:hypothetical protein [Candidatus Micrarchaeota archaeon]